MNEHRQVGGSPRGSLRRRTRFGIGALLSIVATAAQSQDAHVHGSAALTIAIEDQVLAVELASPLANLAGFEHAPKTAAEQEQIVRVRAMLLQADKLFRLPTAAECTAMAGATIDGPKFFKHSNSDVADGDGHLGPDHAKPMADVANDHTDDHHGDDHHGGNRDDEDHHGEGHHDKEHDADDHGDNHDEHTDVRVSYRFSCAAPEKLSTLTLALFETFPSIEALDITALGAAGVLHDERGPDRPVVDLSTL